MDRNENGQIDPDEMEGRARGFLESIARDNNLDLSKPIRNDKLRDILRARFQGGSSGSSRGPSGASGSSSSGNSGPAVKAFGVSTTGPTPTVLDFGADAGADNWDSLRAKYDPRVIEKVEESLRRYDRNQDGMLDAEEMKNGRWDSGHPLDHDKNRDGKVQRSELAERYKARYASGMYGPPSGYGGSYGGGPPGGFSGGFGGGPPSMTVVSSGGVVRSYSPSSSTPTTSTMTSSSSTAKPSSSGGSGPSAPDDRMLRYAEGLLKQYDTNKDGILQRDEWSKMRSESQKADRDGNGLITKDELAAQLADYSKGRSSGSSGSSTGGSSSSGSSSSGSGSSGSGYSYGSRPSVGGPASGGVKSGTVKTYRFLAPAERLPAGLPDWFTRNDGNGDGQISMAEFSTSWDDQRAAEFTRWDRNGDGLVTPKEAIGSGK